MSATIEFVLRHGYAVLIAWVFAEQIGLPIPSMPLLLAAGALAGTGHMSLPLSLLCCVIPAVVADALWFELGRLRGMRVLRLLCKISLEPDSCVRRTQGIFADRGARTLILSKFFPGLNTVAPPLAGVARMAPGRFLLFDTLGSIVWAGTLLGLGYAFAGEIERLAEHAAAMGGWAMAVLGGGLGAYIAYKATKRSLFLRELRTARIGADDLKARIDAGESPVIVDLRHALDVEADPETIPGAFRMDAEALERDSAPLPRDREIILFCT
jgi:membrane protein DedA with SNARE-associated domain